MSAQFQDASSRRRGDLREGSVGGKRRARDGNTIQIGSNSHWRFPKVREAMDCHQDQLQRTSGQARSQWPTSIDYSNGHTAGHGPTERTVATGAMPAATIQAHASQSSWGEAPTRRPHNLARTFGHTTSTGHLLSGYLCAGYPRICAQGPQFCRLETFSVVRCSSNSRQLPPTLNSPLWKTIPTLFLRQCFFNLSSHEQFTGVRGEIRSFLLRGLAAPTCFASDRS